MKKTSTGSDWARSEDSGHPSNARGLFALLTATLVLLACRSSTQQPTPVSTGTAVVPPSTIIAAIQPFRDHASTGPSEADRLSAALNALSWGALDAKLGWRVLHPVSNRFLTDGISRDVFVSPQDGPTYSERYFEAPAGRTGTDVAYVEFPDATPNRHKPAAAKTTSIARFNVEVTEDRGSFSATFLTGESLNGVPIRARASADGASILYAFIALLSAD